MFDEYGIIRANNATCSALSTHCKSRLEPIRRLVAMSESYHIKCKQEKPIDDFGIDRSKPDGKRIYCKVCRIPENVRWHKIRKPRRLHSTLTMYQLSFTRKDFEQLLLQQGGVCAICGEVETATKPGGVKRLCIDHDHNTKKVRGLLCTRCNSGLGWFRDDPTLLAKALEYLSSVEQ